MNNELGLVDILKIIKKDKDLLFAEGNPYFIILDKEEDIFYFIYYTPDEQKELKLVEGVPKHIFEAGTIPMFYTLLTGYRPHQQIISSLVTDIRAEYHSVFNFQLRATNFITEVSYFLSREILDRKGLKYAVNCFIFRLTEQKKAVLTLIEPDGGITDINFFIGGFFDRALAQCEIKKKELFIEKLKTAYNEIKTRVGDKGKTTVLKINALENKIQDFTTDIQKFITSSVSV